AAEIVALKERGVPAEIIVTMLQRGGELRGQAIQTAPMQPQMGTAPYRTPPPEQYSEPLYSDYGYTYPYSYPYYNSYPYYTSYYDYGWPYYGYWPSVYLGFGSYWGRPFYHHYGY